MAMTVTEREKSSAHSGPPQGGALWGEEERRSGADTVNYDAEMARIDVKIEETIKGLNAEKKDLADKKRDQQMQQIYSFMDNVGMTPEEVLEKLKAE